MNTVNKNIPETLVSQVSGIFYLPGCTWILVPKLKYK